MCETLLAVIVLGDLDLARQDQHQARPGLADPRDHFAGLEAARLPEPGEPRELFVGQAREHLRPARRDQGSLCVGHSAPREEGREQVAAFP